MGNTRHDADTRPTSITTRQPDYGLVTTGTEDADHFTVTIRVPKTELQAAWERADQLGLSFAVATETVAKLRRMEAASVGRKSPGKP